MVMYILSTQEVCRTRVQPSSRAMLSRFMSSLIGGRSGNRGRCAQPCRLPYTLVDGQGEDVLGEEAGKYLLSPRDLNTIELLPELIDAGVASLKIEGRMKRPEYVAVVVDTYRRAVDSYLSGEGYTVPAADKRSLAQIFNRDFTTAYLKDRPGRNMMSDRRPNNRGILAGRVVRMDYGSRRVTVHLSDALQEGDQVDFWVKVGGRVTAAIHGKGTGALRKGIQAYLKNHRNVLHMGFADMNEGGTGATVVELK